MLISRMAFAANRTASHAGDYDFIFVPSGFASVAADRGADYNFVFVKAAFAAATNYNFVSKVARFIVTAIKLRLRSNN
jgi:sialic acid synthase SpsE